MALEKPRLVRPPWADPIWPRQFPLAPQLHIIYGELADELVVRFDNTVHHDELVVPIYTPDVEYAGLMVAGDSGNVVGVHVYPLAAFAVQHHPSWRTATKPNPALAVAARIVSDIKELFERYGIEPVFDDRA